VRGAAFGFDQPQAIVAAGRDLFVANGAGDSVTEVDATSRSLVRTISGAQFEFSDPIAMAVRDGDRFVLSAAGRVTEVATATGSLVGVAAGARIGFGAPSSIAASAHDLYVTNRGADTITKMNASTLAFIRPSLGARLPVQQTDGRRHRRERPGGSRTKGPTRQPRSPCRAMGRSGW
jgi:hypothetical protein